jgi:hypothetical protein
VALGGRVGEVLDVAGIPFDLELVVGVITASGEWPVGVQLAPDHVPRSGLTVLPSRSISTSTSKILELHT